MQRSPLAPAEDLLAWERRIISIDLDGLPGEEYLHDVFPAFPCFFC